MFVCTCFDGDGKREKNKKATSHAPVHVAKCTLPHRRYVGDGEKLASLGTLKATP